MASEHELLDLLAEALVDAAIMRAERDAVMALWKRYEAAAKTTLTTEQYDRLMVMFTRKEEETK